jgi:hypothetical protein
MYIHNGETFVESVWYTVYHKQVYGLQCEYALYTCSILYVSLVDLGRTRALRAPVFIGSLTRKTRRCVPPPYLYVNVCIAPGEINDPSLGKNPRINKAAFDTESISLLSCLLLNRWWTEFVYSAFVNALGKQLYLLMVYYQLCVYSWTAGNWNHARTEILGSAPPYLAICMKEICTVGKNK